MRLKLDHGSDAGKEMQVSALCVQHIPVLPFLGTMKVWKWSLRAAISEICGEVQCGLPQEVWGEW